MLPGCDDSSEAVGVNEVASRPPFQFFWGLTEIFQGLVVDDFDLSVRCEKGYETRNAIDDESKTPLVLTQSILSARSIDEVSKLAL
jgi:hypothetical protein